MSISAYSVFTAFLWFNLFIAVLCLLRKTLKYIGHNLFPLILALVLTLARLLLPWEPSFAFVLPSEQVFPVILYALQTELIATNFIHITIWMVVVAILVFVSVVRFNRMLVAFRDKSMNVHALPQADDPRLVPIFEDIVKTCPTKRKCYLYVVDSNDIPYSFGCFHSAIILPEKILSLSDSDLNLILRHEYQHHISKDGIVKLVIECLCCIMWWNPFIHLLRQNLNQTLELKCDAKITENFSRLEKFKYAEVIKRVLALFEGENTYPSKDDSLISISFLGITSKHRDEDDFDEGLIERIEAVLDFDRKDKAKYSFLCAVCVVLLFLSSFSFVVQARFSPSIEDLPSTSTNQEVLQVTPETAFLMDNHDGTYSLLINGHYLHRNIQAESLKHEPYQSLPVITTK